MITFDEIVDPHRMPVSANSLFPLLESMYGKDAIPGDSSVGDVLELFANRAGSRDETEAAMIRDAAERILTQRHATRLADELEVRQPLEVWTREQMASLPILKPVLGGLLFGGTAGVISAPGGVGKSAFILNAACAMYMGVPFLGLETRKTRTLYIAGEGDRGIDRRIKAWEAHNGYDLGSVEIDVLRSPVLTFGTLKDLGKLVEDGGYGLVVADTFATLSTVKNENDNAEVSAWVRAFRESVLEANPEGHALYAHHVTASTDTTGRTKQKSRGASAHRDNADTMLMLTGSADNFSASTEVVKAGKQKDAAPFTLDRLALTEVTFGSGKYDKHVVVTQMDEQQAAAHTAEVRRLVGLLDREATYTSTEMKGLWGLDRNQGKYTAIRSEALTLGLIEKGPGNKDPYARV